MGQGKPKASTPPSLPPAAATPEEISGAAARAGADEAGRLRRRSGRQSTYLTPGFMSPAIKTRPGLKTSLG